MSNSRVPSPTFKPSHPLLESKSSIVTSGSLTSTISVASTKSTNSGEKAKTALTRRLPYAELFFHAIAILLVALILYLNFTNRFWQEVAESGSASDNGLHFSQSSQIHALQFAAKLHELFMQASLSALILYYAHRLLVGEKGVPFGLIDFPYNSNSLGMLRHWRFWQTGFFSTRYLSFAILLLVVCVLSVVVGPSSAILIIPSPGWWPSSNPFDGQDMTTYFLGNTTDIWPTNFTLSSFDPNFVNTEFCQGIPTDPIIGCPLQGFPAIISWFLGFSGGGVANFTTVEVLSNAYRFVSSSNQDESNTYHTAESSVMGSYTTTLTDRMLLSLGTFWSYVQRNSIGEVSKVSRPRLSVKSDIETFQPLVHVACQSYLWNGTRNDVTFLPSINAWNKGADIDGGWTLDGQDPIFDNLPSLIPRFSFFKDRRVTASTSILALAILPIAVLNSTGDQIQGSDVVSCSIDARWAANSISYQPEDFSSILTNLTDPTFFNDINSNVEDTRNKYGIAESPIDLELDWAELVDYNWTGDTAYDYEYNGISPSTTIQGLLFIPLENGTLNEDISYFNVPNKTVDDYYPTIDSTLATLFGIVITDAISRTSSCAPLPILDVNQGNGTLVDLEFLADTPGIYVPSNYDTPGDFVLNYDVERYGYGYGLNSNTSKAALSSLMFYTILVIFHICYVIMLGMRGRYERTTAWGDIHGLVALATNSAPTEALSGTCAGVDERKTWGLKVRAREVGKEHLELVFDDEVELGKRIAVEKKYC